MRYQRYKVNSPSLFFRFPFQTAPGLTVSLFLADLGKAVLATAQVLFLAWFTDEAMQVLSTGILRGTFISSIAYFTGSLLLDRMLDIGIRALSVSFQIQVTSAYERFLLVKQCQLPYLSLEEPDTNDLIGRVVQNQAGKMVEGFYNLLSLMECAVRVLGIVMVTVSASFWIGTAFLLMFLLTLPIIKRCGEANYEAYEKAEKSYRAADYLSKVLSSREYVSERTLFSFSDSLNPQWERHQDNARRIMREANKQNTIRSKAASAAIVTFSILIAVFLLIPAGTGAVSPGLYISVLTATTQLLSIFTWNLSGYLEEFAKNKCYLADLEAFLSLPEISMDLENRQAKEGYDMPVREISFQNVSFRYPNSSQWVLRHLTVTLKAGCTYGFVGKNGAGKTTIMKLLLGIYPDYEGTISINGKNLKDFSPAQLRGLFAVVYQDFCRYQISVWENLVIGNPKVPSLEEVMELLSSLGIADKMKQLPQGLNTEMGQLENTGMDFSGGEWQKIAIARALLRNAPICILDEPTASLDPVHESQLYDLFSQVRQGDIRIMITHKLGGVKNADCILVLESGRIQEQGTHEELMSKGQIYYQMYTSQRRWYQ